MARRLFAVAACALLVPCAARARPAPADPRYLTRIITIGYRAHDGLVRRAYVLLPSWYGPRRHPPIPLVISPHGRGIDALANVRLWGNLPRKGGFAVVSPEGQGRRLELYSWGAPGEIGDLARMPAILSRALPWLEVERRRVYAFGVSMGGQETLLLAARRPRLLAGAAAFDAPTNMVLRYRDFRSIRGGRRLQLLAREEIGGAPWRDRGAYVARSPLDDARRLAFSGVPLQLWWSVADRIVVQAHQSLLLYRTIERLNPHAPVVAVVGGWAHGAEMRATTRLPAALAAFGLLRGPAVDGSAASGLDFD